MEAKDYLKKGISGQFSIVNFPCDQQPLTIAPDTPVTEAIATMNQTGRSYVLVVQQQKLLGIFTERDVVKVASAGMVHSGVAIADVMTKELITLPIIPTPDIVLVESRLRQYQIRHLPLVDEQGQVVRVVTPHTMAAILSAIVTKVEDLQQHLTQKEGELVAANHRWHQEVAVNQQFEEELEENEHAWQLSQERLESILASLEAVVWSFDPSIDKLLYLNSATEQVYGRSITEFFGNLRLWESVVHPEDVETYQLADQTMLSTGAKDIDYRILRPDGAVSWIRHRAHLLTDANNTPIRIYNIAIDITQLKQVEENLKATLVEKEVLLQEIHHRVKNNLQIVSGLLHLQSVTVDQPETRLQLSEARHRLEAMALIHKKLYGASVIGNLDVVDYIQNLAVNLLVAYQVTSDRIQLHTTIEPIPLSIDQAIPCGLIINELVSNSLKYGFPNGRSGEIHIELHRSGDDDVALIVRDNGVGLPEKLDWRNTQSLGLSLVYDLATEQLDGSMFHGHSEGTAFRIVFSTATILEAIGQQS
ncbi:histidine kinase dimerization/phosphoacceptor domain -containing protein [Moorena sp. SIO4G3]|uniref:sensor histidine kinase n=1 Tax=Moorena sp. SIO4G3 TaxID=2607821 RepID=UPI00142BA7F0|nr:histidine kinase dimerization/phosphoacceptor domain -containing protein [Moorena sp. SIO4G3]NEO74971.1 PAS domain-containing protein [Moorena sp. SIO4G3]